MLETAVLLQGTLSTVYAISGWIEQSHAKREKLRQLNRTTQSLSMVLEPLQQPSEAGKLDKRVVALLYEVAEILNGIKEHLVLWGGKQKKSKLVNAISLLSPSVALGMLYDDEKRLAQWMNLFTLSLQVIALRKQVDEKQTIEASAELTLDASWMPRNHDVLSFWSESFGEDKVFVCSAEFVVALQTWVKEDLDETLRNALLLELDRQNIGGVTCRGLEGFASGRTLKECVDDFRSRDTTSDNCYSPARSSTMSENGSSPVSASSSMSLEPTLVWIDDKMGNNKAEIKFATSLGIRVIQLPSTALAKLWIEQNEVELQMLEAQRLIQYITDNARWEAFGGSGMSLNMSAGETILRYLRGRNLKAPVLVYCGGSIPMTTYVTAYSYAASTRHPAVCQAFIKQLVPAEEGKVQEEGLWASFVPGNGFCLVA